MTEIIVLSQVILLAVIPTLHSEPAFEGSEVSNAKKREKPSPIRLWRIESATQ